MKIFAYNVPVAPSNPLIIGIPKNVVEPNVVKTESVVLRSPFSFMKNNSPNPIKITYAINPKINTFNPVVNVSCLISCINALNANAGIATVKTKLLITFPLFASTIPFLRIIYPTKMIEIVEKIAATNVGAVKTFRISAVDI